MVTRFGSEARQGRRTRRDAFKYWKRSWLNWGFYTRWRPRLSKMKVGFCSSARRTKNPADSIPLPRATITRDTIQRRLCLNVLGSGQKLRLLLLEGRATCCRSRDVGSDDRSLPPRLSLCSCSRHTGARQQCHLENLWSSGLGTRKVRLRITNTQG